MDGFDVHTPLAYDAIVDHSGQVRFPMREKSILLPGLPMDGSETIASLHAAVVAQDEFAVDPANGIQCQHNTTATMADHTHCQILDADNMHGINTNGLILRRQASTSSSPEKIHTSLAQYQSTGLAMLTLALEASATNQSSMSVPSDEKCRSVTPPFQDMARLSPPQQAQQHQHHHQQQQQQHQKHHQQHQASQATTPEVPRRRTTITSSTSSSTHRKNKSNLKRMRTSYRLVETVLDGVGHENTVRSVHHHLHHLSNNASSSANISIITPLHQDSSIAATATTTTTSLQAVHDVDPQKDSRMCPHGKVTSPSTVRSTTRVHGSDS